MFKMVSRHWEVTVGRIDICWWNIHSLYEDIKKVAIFGIVTCMRNCKRKVAERFFILLLLMSSSNPLTSVHAVDKGHVSLPIPKLEKLEIFLGISNVFVWIGLKHLLD